MALEQAGLRFPHPEIALAQRALGFRRVVQAASGRLVLVAPRIASGVVLPPHPLWDEIIARLDLDEAAQSRITCSAAELLRGKLWNVARESLTPLALPAGHAEWRVALDAPPAFTRYSASSLSTLLGCPLQWSLSALAGLSSEGTSFPAAALMSGSLGHRLVEELHTQAAFELPEAELRRCAESEVDGLIEREGALLLRPGKAHERDQVRRQLVEAACALHRALHDNGLKLLAVEQEFSVPWGDAQLNGRWDLLAADAAGQRVVIDMKWGQASYKQELQKGDALQLATYTHALQTTEGRPIAAAYFSLSARSLFGHKASSFPNLEELRGPPLSETWKRIESTVPLLEQHIAVGQLSVAGVSKSRPLLETLGIPEADHSQHFNTSPEKVCEYCRFDGLCGRRWELLSRREAE